MLLCKSTFVNGGGSGTGVLLLLLLLGISNTITSLFASTSNAVHPTPVVPPLAAYGAPWSATRSHHSFVHQYSLSIKDPHDAASPQPKLSFENGMPKTFNSSILEPIILRWWQRCDQTLGDAFRSSTSSSVPCISSHLINRKRFYMAMPPPNITGALHLGHALLLAIQDVLIRYRRMLGYSTLWIPGTDHAGIAGNIAFRQHVEDRLRYVKQTQACSKQQMETLLHEWESTQQQLLYNQMYRFGISADWNSSIFTLDRDVSNAVTATFVELYNRGLIYRNSSVVNWCVSLCTAVSDTDIEWVDEVAKLYFYNYTLLGGNTTDASTSFITVATTRPETVFGDAALCVHPEDERYKEIIGRYVKIPLIEKVIPIIADTFVNKTFGTGVLRITPGHDAADYNLGRRHSLQGLRNVVFDKQGKMKRSVGVPYSGMDRLECRDKVWEDLKKRNFAVKAEEYKTRLPHFEKTGELVEPMLSDQWFISTRRMAEEAGRYVKNESIRIIPKQFERTWEAWQRQVHDWCISRQLPYGHQIPVWHLIGRENNNTGEEERVATFVEHDESRAIEAAMKFLSKHKPTSTLLVSNKTGIQDPFRIERDTDVLDTWFSSSLWPLVPLGWPQEGFSKTKWEGKQSMMPYLPADCMVTGYDILQCWVFRMVMLSIELAEIPPFRTVYLHGLVRDGGGQKMSKSKGNSVELMQFVDLYGADSLRFALLANSVAGKDIRVSETKVKKGYKFVNKLWNVGRFILKHVNSSVISDDAKCDENGASALSQEYMSNASIIQRYIVSRIHKLCEDVTAAINAYEFSIAATHLEQFIRREFAAWYLGECSTGVKNTTRQRAAAEKTTSILLYTWKLFLKLMHPFMPFVSETLYQLLPSNGGCGALLSMEWPINEAEPRETLYYSEEAVKLFEATQGIVTEIRNFRVKHRLHPATSFSATIYCKDQKVLKELKGALNTIALYARMDMKDLQAKQWHSIDNKSDTPTLIVSEDVCVQLWCSIGVDPDSEVARQKERLVKLQKEFDRMRRTVSYDGFEQGAPANVVYETKRRLNELTNEIAALSDVLRIR